MLTKVIERKLKILFIIVILIFVALIARLSYLQLVQTQKYQTLSEQNRVRLISMPATRGEILDRTGKQLVKDRPVYVVSVPYEDDKTTMANIDKLTGILGLKPEDVDKLKKTVKDSNLPKYEPIRLMKDVPIDVVTKIEERREELPKVIIDVEPQREYMFGNFLPQVLGYTREISQDELDKNKDSGYKMGDRFGKAGLEKQYQQYLRGTDGARLVEVNNQGRTVKELGLKQPIPGDNLTLNIDYNLQKTAETSLDNTMASLQKQFPDAKAGAIVMLDVNTGKVLAMASKPGYDPSIFNHNLSQADSDTLFTTKPPAIVNRALSGYPPGSTYKMLTATAGLQSGVINSSTLLNDPGYFTLGDTRFNCWQSWGHGSSNVVRALAVSCDVFFYKVGNMAKVENLDKYGTEYGFGQLTGIDLPEDSKGLLPNPQWQENLRGPSIKKEYDQKAKAISEKYDNLIKQATTDKDKARLTKEKENKLKQNDRAFKSAYYYGTRWERYETINMSIGQGDNQITPLQLANYVATIANGGNRFRPYLVSKITDANGKVVKEFQPEVIQKMSVSPENLATVRRGMLAVTTGEGTASSLFAGWPIQVAAKTGTAETGTKTHKTDNHGVFVAFAPYDHPKVAVAAIIEYGGHGASAGAVVRDLLATYFNIGVQNGTAYTAE